MTTTRLPSAVPVPPDAVRVWRGYRRISTASVPPAPMPQKDFLSALGTIFIPATAQLQRLYGLTAYLPTVMPLKKPDGVPDEIALVFYNSQQSYLDTKLRVLGRAYSALHAMVFALPQSESGFPILLQGALKFDQPYHLFNNRADWQLGFTQVFVGARRADTTPKQFAASLFKYLTGLRDNCPKGLDGIVVCARENWVLYWEHWKTETASLNGRISDLPKLADRVLLQPYKATPVPSDLSKPYIGLTVKGGESFNVQFPRSGNSRDMAKEPHYGPTKPVTKLAKYIGSTTRLARAMPRPSKR
jgi:hypothetical protein